MDDRARAWLLLALIASGCAGRAVRPPSPARELDMESSLTALPPEHEHYYILVFSSQLPVRIPKYTHTWATVVRTREAPGGTAPDLEVHTISWMPATLDIHPYRPRVEEGVNLALDATINEMRSHGERISLWGPYETWHGLYERFATQKAFLDGQTIGYQCTDQYGEAARTGTGSNCFHAISDMDPLFDRRQYPLLFYGDAAAQNIVSQLFRRPILIHGCQTHDWLIPLLGLDCQPIVRRVYHGPAKEFSPEAVREEFANPQPQRRRLRV